MKILNKINLKKLFIIVFALLNLIFYFSILLVQGYPETNDILHIFKVTSLEGNLKFINPIQLVVDIFTPIYFLMKTNLYKSWIIFMEKV